MAHFAQIDENNIVLQVIVVDNNDCNGGEFPQSEESGSEFCANLFGGTWKQTSYNNNFRFNYASIGDKFDETRNAFIAPKVFPSWILDESTCKWIPPVAQPNDGLTYAWDEESCNWIEVPSNRPQID